MLAMVKGVMQSLGGGSQTGDVNSSLGDLTAMEQGNNAKFAGEIAFPSDLDTQGFWIDFTAIKRTREKRTERSKEAIIKHHYLPLPPNLNDAYQSNYDQQGLGLIGEFGRSAPGAAADFIDAVGKNDVKSLLNTINLKETGQLAISALKYSAAKLASNPAATGAAVAALTGGGATALAAGAAVGNVFRGAMVDEGIATNPFLAQVFTGVNLRSHNFTFKLVPRSLEESQAIRDMILSFKQNMLPTTKIESKLGKAIQGVTGGTSMDPSGGPGASPTGRDDALASAAARSLFQYPNEWKLSFSPNIAHNLYKINPCVLTNIAVQYHGENKAFYFHDPDGHGNHPMSIGLSLSFMETQIQTREDIVDMESAAEVKRLDQASKALNPDRVAEVTLIESPHRDASGRKISRLKARSLGIIK